MRDAIRRAKDSKEPIELLAQNGDYFHTYRLDYHGGERYPHLEVISGKTGRSDRNRKNESGGWPRPNEVLKALDSNAADSWRSNR